MLDTVVISGDYVCCSVVFGTLVGMSVFCVQFTELVSLYTLDMDFKYILVLVLCGPS